MLVIDAVVCTNSLNIQLHYILTIMESNMKRRKSCVSKRQMRRRIVGAIVEQPSLPIKAGKERTSISEDSFSTHFHIPVYDLNLNRLISGIGNVQYINAVNFYVYVV